MEQAMADERRQTEQRELEQFVSESVERQRGLEEER